jgi:hypothetical protein
VVVSFHRPPEEARILRELETQVTEFEFVVLDEDDFVVSASTSLRLVERPWYLSTGRSIEGPDQSDAAPPTA